MSLIQQKKRELRRKNRVVECKAYNLHAAQNEGDHDVLEVPGANDITAPLPERTLIEMPANKVHKERHAEERNHANPVGVLREKNVQTRHRQITDPHLTM